MKKMMSGMAPSKMGKVKTSPKPDGVAMKGKTRGTMVAMAKAGGMMKAKMAKGGMPKMAMGGKAKMMRKGGAC